MNTRFRRNEARRLFSHHFNRKEDIVHIHKKCTPMHEMLKSAICHTILKKGSHYITEGRFVIHGRCDVFDTVQHKIYEIVNSEKEHSMEFKKNRYPDVDIYWIYCDDYKDLTVDEIYEKLEKVIV